MLCQNICKITVFEWKLSWENLSHSRYNKKFCLDGDWFVHMSTIFKRRIDTKVSAERTEDELYKRNSMQSQGITYFKNLHLDFKSHLTLSKIIP